MSDSPTPYRTCINGHPIASGNQFCTECGSVAAPDAATSCSNGHPIQAGNLFCATCGTEIKSPEPVVDDAAPPAPGLPPPPNPAAPLPAPGSPPPPNRAAPGSAHTNFLFHKTKTGIPVWVIIVSPIIVVLVIFAAGLNHSASGTGSQTQPSQSQSYEDGWNAAISEQLTCNNTIAPNGDVQADFVKGCNDEINALVASLDNGTPTPTTYQSGQ